MDRVAKLCGADIELGNHVLGLERRGTTCSEASRALLREIHGVSGGRTGYGQSGYGSSYQGSSYGEGSYGGSDRPALNGDDTNRYIDGHAYPDRAGSAASHTSRAAVGGSGTNAAHRFDPQDWGRKYLLTNGGCAYIDLDHLELCLPECLSAWDHVANWHALLGMTREALAAANASQPEDVRIQALVNNSDGLGNSYGSHLDFLVTRRAWRDLFHRRPHFLAYLAAYQVSSIVFTGQGKVGSENGLPGEGFQISQRADMIETLVGQQTTYQRPLLNTRDEPLSGPRWGGYRSADDGMPLGDRLARLHVIFYDNTLSPTACLLKVGVMQIVLAMLEARSVDASLALDDPLHTLWVWSRDPDLRTTAPLCSGDHVTPVELQHRFAAAARRFVDAGGCEEIVPRAGEILDLWEDTLDLLARRDLDALAGRLDWVLKRSILERTRARHDLDWTSPELKHLDLLYSSLDPREGLFWIYEAAGGIEPVVTAERIAHFRRHPPDDTRAWGRTMLLRAAGPDRTVSVDWDAVEVRVPGRLPGYSRRVRVDLADPLGWTRNDLAHVFPREEAPELGDLIHLLAEHRDGAVEVSSWSPRTRSAGVPHIRQIPADTRTWRNRNGNP